MKRNFHWPKNPSGKISQILLDEAKNQKNAEWKILKQFQRDERTQFFAEGKIGIFAIAIIDLSRGAGGISRTLVGILRLAPPTGLIPMRWPRSRPNSSRSRKAVLDARRDEACKD